MSWWAREEGERVVSACSTEWGSTRAEAAVEQKRTDLDDGELLNEGVLVEADDAVVVG